MHKINISAHMQGKKKGKHKPRGSTFSLNLVWLHPCLWCLNSLCSCKLLSCLLEALFLVILYKLHHRHNVSERGSAVHTSCAMEELCITASAQRQINVIPECSTYFLRASSQLPKTTHQLQKCVAFVFSITIFFAFWDLIGYSYKTPQLLL